MIKMVKIIAIKIIHQYWILNPMHSASSSILFSSNNDPLNRILKILFKYSCFTVFCCFLLYRKVIQLYAQIYIFSYSFTHDLSWDTENSFVLCSRNLLCIHAIYSNLPLLIPNSQTSLPQPTPSWQLKSM